MYSMNQSGQPPLRVGSKLEDRYKITAHLSIHDSSRVYQARDMNFPNVQRIVAIKEIFYISAKADLRAMMLQNFNDAVMLYAEMNHPNIIRIFDHFSVRDAAYIVMQYVNGMDLQYLVRRQTNFLPITMVVKWAIQLCDVLHYLHSKEHKPVIFRNLKPTHVMINQFGDCQLVDYGFATAIWGYETWLNSGLNAYSAPESQNSPPSPSDDIYSLGATLHYALTKQDAANEAPFSFAQRPIQEANLGVPPELEAVIMRAVQRDPSDRYPDILAMKHDLETVPY